jgi:hypothetical protein
MANTTIQIKRSGVTSQPASLAAAEPAYSYLSDKLFIGNATGSGVIAIGGKYFIDQLNVAFAVANAAYGVANSSTVANAAYDVANAAFGKANAANVLAYNTGIGANAYATLVGTSGNAYATLVGTSGNAYADVVGAASNAWANTVGTSGNAYASVVGTNANNYSNATFVKLVAGSQTITGDFSITGNLFIGGNTTSVSANNLVVNDPLIYLANGNPSDIVDIGFVGSYVNGTSAHVHTGLFRDHSSKQYYLFQGFDADPELNNDLTPYANNMVNATLIADFVTSNLTLGGANAIVWIKSAYDNANGGFGVTNAAFGHSNTTYAAVNSAFGVINASFGVANASYGQVNTLATSANAYATAVGAAGNAYTVSVGTSGNAYASAVGTSANVYAAAVGTSANAYADIVGGAANTNAANASYLSTGTVIVARGGTGLNSITANGVIYGNGTGAVGVTSAGSEGNVLQVNASGIPAFGMLDGGTF